jgi:hypothetical protein
MHRRAGYWPRYLPVLTWSFSVGAARPGTGTVIHAVLNHAHCPVAIIPD